MNLIAYSDSESDGEAPTAAPAPKPAPRAFQKVIDRSNPGRIKLNLPGASPATTDNDDTGSEAPPAKKARIGGGGGLGGFNSMLPAPKKANVKVPAASATPGSRGLGRGLGAGVNLRTGAEPAFKREAKLELEEYDESGNVIKKEPMKKDDFRALLNLPAPKSEQNASPKPESPAPAPGPTESAPAPKPAAPRFVPMSVGKGKKKKPVVPRPVASPAPDSKVSSAPTAEAAPPKPKVSLFGVSQEQEAPANGPASGAYQPMMYGFDEEEGDDDAADEAPMTQQTHHPAQYVPAPPAANELTNIASELNLSETERRQLFGKKGRNGPDFSSARIVEFNTDTEYAHNEHLRQQGEQVQHNPLKSISGTGKNSLRSLVNVATTQKDALEEHIAQGHRNKREAGNRYGW
ncbi:uncharacterized protein M421DRAFT_65352 [Didymella exigua CBS 183.55]|uniref:Mitotic checkpoint regulator, MAD2B-interacting-domain-containing protein n=1 Tax=Didymella exigua CBS 183.55 TaxID=1150837 RepID=A0A6A5RI50_9PLEO|nr:uncharacterized protein M421DRAFT_65352 [Didymella exigua CBS 183.55]KAF1927482.1 hypothetical protein M421DRAFT_65352 [Didymella exigua CBS 183.55]